MSTSACARCGKEQVISSLDEGGCCFQCRSKAVSVADDSLDSLVQAASVPDLAALMRKAKDRGVIGPVTMYGEGSAPA